MQTNVDPKKIAAYEATTFWVQGREGVDFALRLGQCSPELLDLYKETQTLSAVFITAYNPFGEVREASVNKEANRRLLAHLQDISAHVFPGHGGDPDQEWPPEPSFLALGMTEEAAHSAGLLFQQDAVLWAGEDGVPSLQLLR